uniref:C2H2-type domain-containing protein n=1 Tax=Aureoumbra lagunensis TaxID=44058 RepID=A0A7S3JUZ5_9STRA
MRRYRKARRRTPLEMSKDGYIPEAKLHSLVIPNWEEVKNLFQIIPRKKIPPKLKLLQLPHICVKEFFQYEPLFVSVVSSGNQSFVSRCMGDVILRLAPPRIALEVVISGRRWRMDGTVSEFGRIAICDRDLRFDPIECPYCFERFSSPAERKLHRKLHKLPNNTQLKYDAELRLRFERIGSNFHWYREDACCPQVAPCTWTGSPALWTPADDDECILFGEVRRTSILSLRLRPVYNTQSQAAFFIIIISPLCTC